MPKSQEVTSFRTLFVRVDRKLTFKYFIRFWAYFYISIFVLFLGEELNFLRKRGNIGIVSVSSFLFHQSKASDLHLTVGAGFCEFSKEYSGEDKGPSQIDYHQIPSRINRIRSPFSLTSKQADKAKEKRKELKREKKRVFTFSFSAAASSTPEDSNNFNNQDTNNSEKSDDYRSSCENYFPNFSPEIEEQTNKNNSNSSNHNNHNKRMEKEKELHELSKVKGILGEAPSIGENEKDENAQEKEEKPLLALPEASTSTENKKEEEKDKDSVRKLEVGGSGIALDELGPVIINKDGTMRRIANWANLSPQEQAVTLRRIGKRNQERVQELQKAQQEEEQSSSTSPENEKQVSENESGSKDGDGDGK